MKNTDQGEEMSDPMKEPGWPWMPEQAEEEATEPKEWTAEWVYEYAHKHEGYKTICELHNAAIAAEREKPKTTEYARGWDDHVAASKGIVHAFESERDLRKRYEDQLVALVAARREGEKP